MGSFGVNFNFDFGNIKLDKLFDDANKSEKANLSSNQIDVSSNYNANSANNYSGNNKDSVETMDFSSKVNNKNQNNGININNNSTNNVTNETNSNMDSSKMNINTQNNNNNNQNFSTLNQNSSNQNTKDNNVNVNSESTSDMKNNISNSNTSTNSMSNSNSANNQNVSVDTNSSKVDITSNNSKNDIDISKNSSTINNTSTNSSSGSNSATMNNSSNISTGNNSSSIDVSINMDNQETSEDSDNMTVKDGKVIIVTTDQSGNQVNIEIDVEDYKSNLKVYGFTEEDINRIISGEISPEKLLEEIQSDSDNTRRKKMMESSYLQAYGLNFNDMSELKNACAEKEKELENLLDQRENVDNNRELDSIMNIITRLKMGESLDNILKSEIVAWKYTDENGNTCYRYDDPYINGNYDGITYESLYFSDMYQDSEMLKKLQNVLSVETIDPLFGDKYQVQRWTESDEQQKFFDDLAKKYSESVEKRQSEVKKLDEKITELQQQKETYEYVYNYIDKEVNYYLTNIDSYTSREDFYLNNSFNSKSLDKVNELNKKYNGIQMYDYSSGISNVYINEKSEMVDIISCMLNGKGNISNGYLSLGTSIVQLSSRDDMLAHYEKWLPFVTENEIQVFNYIYNTQGTDKAYEYLENISDELDNRWLANKTQEDQEFASAHPVLASIGSIVVTPIEGISAVCYSMNSYFTGEKIRRADVYSAGDVWRAQVSQDIAENYGEGWAFAYSTGMSMADSVSLIALSAATGGVATPVLSATLMGSRAYVSTLNDALDRGLSDGSAILLASTSAIVETAMESYSVGHLLNLEGKLGKTTLELTSKIANNIGNKTVANLVTKSFYIGASALSQGLAEGEEEFATEILNYVADIFIAKDLSNYTQSINQYLELGYSEDQALFSTMNDFGNQAFQAFLGGFVSGVCFGTFGGSTSTLNTSYGISNQMYTDLQGSTKAQQFVEALEINQQQIQEYSDALKDMKNGKTLNDEQISLLNNGTIEMQASMNLREEIANYIVKPLSDLNLDSTTLSILDIKKATLGSIASIPAVFNKFRLSLLSSNQNLISKISKEGLLHLTTEEAAKKIIESGYIKASKNPITSYGSPKAFFFSGIPEFGNACLNIGFNEKFVAIRIKPEAEILNQNSFKYRAHDDFVITHDGNFHFDPSNVETVYLGLIVNDKGMFEYKEISKNEYNDYVPDTKSISRNAPKIIKSIIDSIKMYVFGVSYQYDAFVGNLTLNIENAMLEDEISQSSNLKNKSIQISHEDPLNINSSSLDLNQEMTSRIEKILFSRGLRQNAVYELLNDQYHKFGLLEQIPSIVDSDKYSSILNKLDDGYKLEEMEGLGISLDLIREFKSLLQQNNLSVENVIAFNKYTSDSNMILGIKRGVSRESILENISSEFSSRLTKYEFSLEQIEKIKNFVSGLNYNEPLHNNYTLVSNYLEQFNIPQKYIATIQGYVKCLDLYYNMDEILSNLDNGLKTQLSNSIILYRAVKSDFLRSVLNDNENLTNLIGRTIEETGYSSTSPIYSSSFAKYDDYDVIFEIYTPKGTQGISVSSFSAYGNTEAEFLMNSNDLIITDVISNYVDENGKVKTLLKAIMVSKDIQCYENVKRSDTVSIETEQLSTNPQITKFISYFDDFKEEVKNITGKTNEELSHFDDFRTKVISYGSIEQIIENLDSFNDWEMRRLLNIESPIVAELFNNQKIINYVTENMSRKDIMSYSTVIPSHPIIESTFLSLTDEEVEEIGSWTILNEFKKFSLDAQKQFVDYHEKFFVKELNSIFSKNLDKDTFMIIFNKMGSFEFLQNNKWRISNLSSEIQNELYNKYKDILYTGTQKQFTEFVKKINDPDYQTQFIKNSPFYSEMINSTDFEDIFSNIKDKNFALEIYSNPDAKNKILASGTCFKKLLSFLTIEEQLDYLSIAKNRIIEVANSKIDNAVYPISSYITAFDNSNQMILLNDHQIIKSMDSNTIIGLNKMFDGIYNEEILKWTSDTMDDSKAKMLFIPEIYEKMDQVAINKAAVALPVYYYNDLIKLNNNEAIDAVLDSLISQNFRTFKSYSGFRYLDDFINLYKVLDEEGKQKIKDNISSSMLVSVLACKEEESLSECLIQKLANDTEYFDTLTLEDLRKISSFSTDLYRKICEYLRPQFKMVTFNLDNIISLNIQEELIEVFRDKPNLVNYLNVENCSIADFLSLLSTDEDTELLYDNLNVETIVSLLGKYSKNESYLAKLHTLDFERLKKCIVNNIANLDLEIKRTTNGMIRIDDYARISRVLKMFNYQEQVEILDAMKKSDKYLMLFLNLISDQDVKFKILNGVMFDPKLRNSILDDNMELFTNFFDNLDINTIEYVMNNMNNNFLGFVMSITKRNDLNVKFNKIIENNPLILSQFNYADAEMVYSNLSRENADIIDKYIEKYLKEIQNNNLDILLSDATTAQKSAFLDAYNNGLINDEKIELLIKIKSKNRFVLSTFNYSLFDETIYQFGDSLLTKLSKYYDVVDQIVELKKNPQKFNLFAQFVINDTTSSSPIVADQKMAILLNYLLENNISPELLSVNNQEELETARNIILKQIDQFSILDSFEKELVRDRSIITPDNFTLKDYNLKLAEKCDDMLKNATSVSEVQNLIFNKYFSISIEDATELFRMYGSRFASIKGLDTDGIATTYLENMKNILNMSMEEAIDYYNSFDTINRYSMNDTLNILNSIKQIYTKSLKSTLFNPTDITGYVDYDGKKIPIYQPKGDFQMLIQSTYTNYGGMPMINDNYFDSWNLSSRTANHGICCSLISNNNMGMAMLRGPGVVIGFNNFSDEQMNMMAPYDIYTRNDGYVIKCQRPLLYLPGQDVMNETRHTHNEFNLERTNLTGEGELANIQPDYVVVFEEMSEEQKQNAYKASVEFSVPLVYINKNSLAVSESAKIDGLISEYKNTGKVELLKDILILHENNRSGYRNPTDSSLVTQYFSSDRIISVLNEAIENIASEKELQYIKDFLEDEIRKFDATLEATNRVNEIDIDAKGLIEQINTKLIEINELSKENTGKLQIDALFKRKDVNISKNSSNLNIVSNLTSEQINWINKVNSLLKNNETVSINLKNTKSITSEMLKYVTDLSRISVRMDLSLSDFYGNYMSKYEKNKYIERVTYSGNETYSILKKIEELESKVDMTLPITMRAKQIYEIISSEIPVMYNRPTHDHFLVSQSLRGIVSNNIVGEAGLICAGYSALFRELCTRCNIQCDYIRGKAVLDLLTGKGGGHAWNIFIDENNNPIPVDVTWKATSGDDWFGGSQKFQESHIADSDEIFKNYMISANIVQSSKSDMLNTIVSTMDQYYGYGSGINALKEYINSGDVKKITRQNEARDLLQYLNKDDIIDYVNLYSSNINQPLVNKQEIIDNILSSVISNYGEGYGFYALQEYVRTGDPTKITRKNGARDSLQYISKMEISEYLTTKMNIIQNIISTMDQYYGEGSGIESLRRYIKYEDRKAVTRQNGARESLKNLTIMEIKEYLKLVN